jgi:hypothetical protein
MTEEKETQQTGSGTTDAQGKLQSSRTHVRQAAEDLKAAAGVIAGEYRGKAEQVWDDARDRVRIFQQDADQLCARKSDQGSIHSARNRVCPGPNLSALIALRSE